VVARGIHAAGNRNRGPWVAVNRSAVPEPLLEAELFGYVRGAFTGAVQTRLGKFEASNRGTIFLDKFRAIERMESKVLNRAALERLMQHTSGWYEPPETSRPSPRFLRTFNRGRALTNSESSRALKRQSSLRPLPARGNKTAAARMLGLKRTTLSAKLRTLEGSLPRLVA